MTMRMQLARIHQAGKQFKSPKQRARVPYNPLGFDPYDHSILPRRLIVMGRASDSRVMVDMLSSILGAPVFQASSLAPATYSPLFNGSGSSVSSAGMGAAYRAVYCHENARRLGPAEPYGQFLSERFRQRADRLRGATFEGRRPSIPIITTSIASFEAPEPSVRATSPLTPRRMSFSTVKITPGLSLNRPGSPPTPSCGSILVVPIHTDPDDAEAGLIKVADPDEDLYVVD